MMKKISGWARDHIWQARLIIVVIYILLNVIGIFTGKLLREVDVILPQGYLIGCLIFTIALWTWYPDKNSKSVSAPYVRRKLFDFSLAAVTYLMILFAGNNWDHLFINSESAKASKIIRIPRDSVTTNNILIKDFITSIKNMDVSKLSQKEKIRLIKKQIKQVKQDNNTSKSDKTLLIVLSVLVALILLYGLAALSCSISCGGSEALAIVVALAGTFLIIFFLVKIIKRINNPRPKNKEENKMPEK
ncbi:MAG TPA: hypothetical protein VMY77_08655 [Chitinophagaceae bacterium]|nr:hypothetical protein [Chitinophagaceae bacterium]